MSNKSYLRLALDKITFDDVKPLSCVEFDDVMDILCHWQSDYGDESRFMDGVYMGLLCRQAGRVSHNHRYIIGDKEYQSFRVGYIRGLRDDYNLLMDAIRRVVYTHKPKAVNHAKN